MELSQTKLYVFAFFSAIGTAFSWLVGGVDAPIQYFLLLTASDYVSGMVAAWRTGSLSSGKACNGIKRKVIIIAVIIGASIIDGAASLNHVLRGAVLVTYAIMEAMSIIENIDKAGWGEHIPLFLRSKLAQIKEEKVKL